MANILNPISAFYSLIIGMAFTYAFWSPISTIITNMATAIMVLAGTAWVMMTLFGLIFAPATMAVADDTGG